MLIQHSVDYLSNMLEIITEVVSLLHLALNCTASLAEGLAT